MSVSTFTSYWHWLLPVVFFCHFFIFVLLLLYTAADLFNPEGAVPGCDKTDSATMEAWTKQRYAAVPPPSDEKETLRRIQQALGKGVAAPIDSLPDFISGKYLNGGTSAGSAFSEAFLMQLALNGSLADVAWGRLDSLSDLYDMMKAHIYFRGTFRHLSHVCCVDSVCVCVWCLSISLFRTPLRCTGSTLP